MDLRTNRTKDVLKKEEFRQSVLGINVSASGVTFCLHSASQDDSDLYIQFEKGKFSKEEILKKIEDFDNMINSFDPSISILSTTISFPGPVENDTVEITNWWLTGDNHFTVDDFSVFKCCNSKKFSMINDIRAYGQAIISIDELYGLEDDFLPLWKPPSMDQMPQLYPLYFASDAAVVMQISSGLGAAFIIPMDSTNSYSVISSEWGHSVLQICGPEEPQYEEELELVSFIRNKKGAAAEWEDVCSCRGLKICYDFELWKKMNENSQSNNLKSLYNHSTSDEFEIIREIMKDSDDPIVKKAFEIHFKFIMRFAKTCAVGFKCKSVFITYSVFNDGPKYLQKNLAICRDEFMHFTRSEWVSNVLVFVQCSDKNLSALGALYHAFNELAKIESKTSSPLSEIDKIEINS